MAHKFSGYWDGPPSSDPLKFYDSKSPFLSPATALRAGGMVIQPWPFTSTAQRRVEMTVTSGFTETDRESHSQLGEVSKKYTPKFLTAYW